MKNNHLRLGALNKETNNYELPEYANKNNKYQCPGCKKDVILRKGKILKPHFAHYKSENPCTFYNHPGESYIHKHAKHCIKKLLESKIPITILTKCQRCNETEEVDIEEIGENSKIIIEYSFMFNESRKFADVAYIDDNEIVCIFEICNKHKTDSENRPEPWFEFKAEIINKQLDDLNILDKIQLQCIRENYYCEECAKKIEIKNYKSKYLNECGKKYLSELNHDELENYIKNKLELAYPGRNTINSKNNRYGRFEFHATDEDEIIHNKKIMELFKDDLCYDTIITTYKGSANIVCLKPYPERSFKNVNDYWSAHYNYYYSNHKDIILFIDGTSLGTREIIEETFKEMFEYNNIKVFKKKFEYKKKKVFKELSEYIKKKEISEYEKNCHNWITNLCNDYKDKIYNDTELEKKLFNECYYLKYYKCINTIKSDGKEWNIWSNKEEPLWGGWKSCGLKRQTMTTFMKHYHLIDPMKIDKHLKHKYG